MATNASFTTSTTNLVGRLKSSIVAVGNGNYFNGALNRPSYLNLKVGFVYSTMPINFTTTAGAVPYDTLVPSPGQYIETIFKPESYAGGATFLNLDYSIKITGLISNTTYYIRSFIYSGSTGYYKYGNELSGTTLGNSAGYFISNDTVGFYSPLQIRDSSEGLEKVLTTDSSGLATWKSARSLFAYGHYIGEKYGGGIVAGVWKEGDDEKVLIVSMEDLNKSFWSSLPGRTVEIGPSAQSKYNGYLNSAAMVAQSNTLSSTTAANATAEYRGGGYDDWYLPSYYEMNQVFNNAAIINNVLDAESFGGGISSRGEYWTSTEYSATQSISLFRSESKSYGSYNITSKGSSANIRAVRKESVYTGDGLVLNLDATNIKSFSDLDYLNIGTSSRWRCLVNGGSTSSYAFNLSAHPTTSSGGTIQPLIQDLLTVNSDSLAYRKVGNWWIDKITGVSTPTLYNNTGTSSMTSEYFSVTNANAYLQFDTLDQSTVKDSSKATINVYVSVRQSGYDSQYLLIRQITNTVGNNNISPTSVFVPLYSYYGKTISIRMTAPNAYYGGTDNGGPSIDNLYVRGVSGGYRATGPIYFPDESGFLRLLSNATAGSKATQGSYVDFRAPIGNATKITVEMWARIGTLGNTINYNILFGWNAYNVYTLTGGLGYNTGNSDLYGISSATVQSLNIVGNWAHYVFEMNSNVSYTNNKIYINGDEQTLSQVASSELSGNRNFNPVVPGYGYGRIGGFRAIDEYFINADIAVFRVYNRALTKDEIMKNYSFEKKRYEILPRILNNGILTSIDFDSSASYSGDGNSSGSVSDLSGNGRAAILQISGTTVKPAVQKTTTLYSGKELVFPGTTALNPYLYWSTNGNSLQTFTNVSVSFWVKFAEHRTSEIIVKWDSALNTTGPWEVYQTNSSVPSKIAFSLKGSTTEERIGTKNLELNRWTHVSATYDNTTKKMKTYIDGVLDIDSSVPAAFSLSTSLGDIFVGQYPESVPNNTFRYPMYGSIANIQIYSKALSYGEVKNNYDAGKFKFDNLSDANRFLSHEINGNPTFSISQNLSLDLPGVNNEKILKMNLSGYAKWVDKTSIFTRPTNYRYIGEHYGGGIIVAMWYYPKTIYNYLIMSLEDVSASSAWSNVTNALASANSDFKGELNQTAILSQSLHTTSAAKLCDDYAGGEFTDWYLPSVFEMNQAFNAGSIIGTVLGSDALAGEYWTSTETGTNHAYAYSFTGNSSSDYIPSIGYQKERPKTKLNKVRAFRLATNAPIVNPWDPTWDEEYSPWYPRRYWEYDWEPATYEPISFDYFARTRVTTGLPVYNFTTGLFDVNGSTITTWETVLEFGVCWKSWVGITNPGLPTVADNRKIGSGDYNLFDSKSLTNGVFNVRAYVTTTSGTYYGNSYTGGYE